MAAQTAYELQQEKGYPGVIFAQQPSKIISMPADPTVPINGIPFGVAVGLSAPVGAGVVVAPSLANFLGVSVRPQDNMQPVGAGPYKYEDKDTVAVLQRGYIWVTCLNGCLPDDLVYYDDTTGEFQTTTGADEILLPGARWVSTASAGDVALLTIQTSMASIDIPEL